MNILVNLPAGFFTHSYLEPVWSRLQQLGEVRYCSHNDGAALAPELHDVDATLLWSWPVWTPGLLDAAPNLSFAGHIDITQQGALEILKRDIAVSISRHGFSPAVAEMALALLLNALRSVSNYHAQMRTSDEVWVKQFPEDIPTYERELHGMKVGIIGFGRVGQRLAQLLEPFECVLQVYDPYVSSEVLELRRARSVTLDTLMRDNEAVVLCAASNSGSKHLLGPDEIELLRPSAIFINVARAALLDTGALCSRLKRGDLTAALDVFDHEPLESNSTLRSLSNVYLTPHRAGGTLASVKRTLDWLIDDLEANRDGRARQHTLIPAMLPSLDA